MVNQVFFVFARFSPKKCDLRASAQTWGVLVNWDITDSRFRAKIGKPSRLSIETLGTVETQREERERTQEGGGMVQIWPCYQFCGVWFGSIGIVEGTIDPAAPIDDGIESSD